ncbi:ABC transporter permease subunit [Paenibacillus sp. 2TAB23]|uniref:ABC transporter permease subunit n=1 Tax=Paenibacillus sp. 2TAB23 TaxID=3233004 RepID=UPI003F9AA66D
MNIFWIEMKVYSKSLIFWSIGMIFLIASSMGKYAGLSSSGQSMSDLMAGMPKSLQALMGIGTLDLSKASGYYGVIFVYLVLMGTIHATMIGANIIAKEERDKTAEFLFVKPISKNKVILSKLLAALANLAVLNIVSLVASLILVVKYSKGESVSGDIAITMAGMFILQLLFLVIGSATAAVYNNPKKAAPLSTGVLLVTYMLSIAIDLNVHLNFLKYLSPFKYFEAKNLMYGGGFEASFLLLSIVLIAALTVITFMCFKKRDLRL